MKKVAVILSGCGYLDGAEIRKAVFTLLAIDKMGATPVFIAPNQNQHHTVNHLKGEEASGSRNVLEEAARIARGDIKTFADVSVDEFDCVAIPGGFGVAKNLSNFAFKGSAGEIIPEFSQFLLQAHQKGLPIGAICISPAVITLLFGKDGVEVTIGSDQGTASELEKTGAKHIAKAANECHIDTKMKVVSTPAYMCDASPSDIYQGIENCIKETLALC